MTQTKYSKFKKLFKGDPKINITAIDKNGNVLAHRAITCDENLEIEAALKNLWADIKDKDKVAKYEVVYPNKV